ncbi:hypothetical protein [Winogradskyella thalassocola]|nr:hypothetical protein [Winogradskyella thalassocola]
MRKQVLIHSIAAVMFSIILYKLASFTLETSIFIALGTAILGLSYSTKGSKK